MLVKLCLESSGNWLKYWICSFLKNSFMVLKQVLRKKKSNYLAYFTFTILNSVSTSAEFSDEDFVTEDTFLSLYGDVFFSLIGDGYIFSFYSYLISLFLSIGMWTGTTFCFISWRGSVKRLSIKAILSSFCYFYYLKLIGNRTLNVDLRSHLSAVISGSKNFMVQMPFSSFWLPPPVNGAHNSVFWGVIIVELVSWKREEALIWFLILLGVAALLLLVIFNQSILIILNK